MVFMFASEGIEKLLITRTEGVDYIWQRVVILKRFVFFKIILLSFDFKI